MDTVKQETLALLNFGETLFNERNIEKMLA